ncbi:MAG TPA: isocitrate dehydrogenase, partial [Chloroflexota bacterium]
AMILAAGSLLGHFEDEPAQRVSRAISTATFDTLNEGIRTVDLGGQATTTEFTDAIIARLRRALRSG